MSDRSDELVRSTSHAPTRGAFRDDALRDWHVCVICDRLLGRGRTLLEQTEAALAGGADVIQLRDKTASGRELFELGRSMLALTRAAGAAFVVNDRVDLALALGADGIHVGQHDLPADTVRAMIASSGMVLGVSARSLHEAERAMHDGADYLGLGPVFDATASKHDAAPPIGLDGLARVRAAFDLPVLAIGGIDHGNAESVVRAGADGVAVISCVVGADDIARAVRELRERVMRGKG